MNRKNIEVMVKAGAFDGVGAMSRAQYFYKESDDDASPTFLERLVRWAIRNHEAANASQMSIFDVSEEMRKEAQPPLPQCEEWSTLQRCREEMSVVGFYLSGHPLDDYKYEIQSLVNAKCNDLNHLEQFIDRDVRICCIITNVKQGTSPKTAVLTAPSPQKTSPVPSASPSTTTAMSTGKAIYSPTTAFLSAPQSPSPYTRTRTQANSKG